MPCTVEARERAKRAADTLRALAPVVAVDVLAPTTGSRACWSLEFTTTSAPAGQVLGTLAEHDCAVPDISPQGPDHYVVVATT